MKSAAITVRADESLLASLDELVEYMLLRNRDIGLKPTRSDAVRLCITGYLIDHGDTFRALLEKERAKQP